MKPIHPEPSQMGERKKGMTQNTSKKRPMNINSSTNSKSKKIRKIDVDDDLSHDLDPSPRSQRRAAAVAKTRLKAISRESYDDGVSSDEESDYGDDDITNDEPDVSEEDVQEESSDESESTSDDDNLKRARDAQEKALQRAKKSGKKTFETSSDEKKRQEAMKVKDDSRYHRGQVVKITRAAVTSKTSTTKIKTVTPEHGFLSESDDDKSNYSMDMEVLLQEAMAGAKMSALHSVCWWRIVLDEAHMIKSRSSQTAAAAFSLIGVHRWCLSGTPLQNRVGEFYSLVRFLRIDPMAHYLCRHKGCTCKSIHYRMFEGKCRGCGHGSVEHFSYFNKHILNPIQRDGYVLG